MSFIAKQKLVYYKRYKVDIWGFLHNTLQALLDFTKYHCQNLTFKIKLLKNINAKKKYEIKRARANIVKFRKLYREKRIKYSIYKDKKQILKDKRWMRRCNGIRILLYLNLLMKVFKLTISMKVNKMFRFLMLRKKKDRKYIFENHLFMNQENL